MDLKDQASGNAFEISRMKEEGVGACVSVCVTDGINLSWRALKSG